MTTSTRRSASPTTSEDALHEIAQAREAGFPFYVYTLSDADGVFYVGKGTGRRMFSHAANKTDDTNYRKMDKIAKAGSDLRRKVCAYFREEGAAFDHETSLIASGAQSLTNIQPGQTTPRQRCINRAAYLLARVRPFGKTILAKLPQGRFAYDLLVAEVASQVKNPCPREVSINTRTKEVTYGW